MAKPFLISAVVGNARMLATLGTNGELYRLFWPHVDHAQHVDQMFGGIYAGDFGQSVFWLNDGQHWQFEQLLQGDVPVCTTKAKGHHLPLQVTVTDYAVPDQDILVRHYVFENRSPDPIAFKFLFYSSMYLDGHSMGNGVLYHPFADALVHFRHDYAFGVASNQPIVGYQCGNALNDAGDGQLSGAPNTLGADGCVVWHIDKLSGSQTKELTLYITAGKGIKTAMANLKTARDSGHRVLLQQTLNYWLQYLGPEAEDITGNLFRRSLAVCRLLTDGRTGAVIAAPEIDEHYHMCGGYGYCWPRDGVIVAYAMGRAGFNRFSEQYYSWCTVAQAEHGAWMQRYDSKGFLGPSWGNQIDETGSVLWGMWQHYRQTGDEEFLQKIWPSLEQGVNYLCDKIDPKTNLPTPSFDLWEERVGEHAYSSAAVAAGFVGAAEIAARLNHNELSAQWKDTADRIKKGIGDNLWSEEQGYFLRTVMKMVGHDEYCRCQNAGKKAGVSDDGGGTRSYYVWADEIVDASVLGLVYPYGILSPHDPRVLKTVQAIENRLTAPGVGGIKRYENDHYIGGNPWIITTLWLALYYITAGSRERAEFYLKWVEDHQTELGYLSEQISKESGRPNWVIPLTWSHAMYILTVMEMRQKGWLK